MRLCGLWVHSFLLGTAVCFAADQPNASPLVPPAPPAAEAPGADALIANLAAENYKEREEATRKLWEMGTSVLEPLKKAMQGDDPEITFRVSGLIRNIEHHITPDTDPAMIELVERYFKANTEEKKDILTQIRTRRGWHQFLKLYESETDQAIRDDMRADVHGIAITAAREKLIEDKPQEALKFLQLAPQDNQSLMSIAAFHRAQGTLEAEIERAKGLPGVEGARLRAALYRTAGNLEEALKAAIEAKDESLAAEIALHQGNPLPLLELVGKNGNDNPLRAAYLAAVSRKWKGETVKESDLEPFVKMLSSRDEEGRASGMASLFLLGRPAPAEPVFAKASPLQASSYLKSIERVPEAMAVLGLDARKPDFTGWVAKRFARIVSDEDDSSLASDELMHIASLMTQLGLHSELVSAFEKPMLNLADEDEDTFISMIERMFSGSGSGRVAADLGRAIGVRWAGDDAGRWRTLATLAFEENEPIMEWWDWTAELDPKATPADRFDGVLAMLTYTRDPKRLGARWLNLAWKAAEKAPEGQKVKLLKRIGYMSEGSARTGRSGDIANSLKVWDQLPKDERGDPIQAAPYLGLSATGRWEEAAEVFKSILDRDTKAGAAGARVFIHSYTAASLRRAGKEKDALIQDELVEKLTLGDWGTAYENYKGYAYGGDSERAAKWLARAITEGPLGGEGTRTGEYSDWLLEQGQWKNAAALAEVVALRTLGQDLNGVSPAELLLLRLKVDLPFALSILETDRPAALKMLSECHGFFPSGGWLADFFFPAVRKAGLIKQHDEWFESSWKIFEERIENYPASDQLRNGAGWLAGRAARRLDEAENHMTHALTLNPDQAAYLDTMAEIQFAKRDRKAALKWSAQAVNFSPGDPTIRRQYDRFTNQPFPEN